MNKDSNANTKTDLIEHLITEFEHISNGTAIPVFRTTEYIELIKFFVLESNYDKALEVVEVALEHLGNQNELVIHKAQVLILLKDSVSAYETLKSLVPDVQTEYDVMLMKAQCMIAENQFDMAFSLLKAPFRFGTIDEKLKAALLKVTIYEEMSDYQSMFNSIKFVLDRDPGNEQAMEKLWDFMDGQRSYRPGITYLEKLLNKDPYSFLAWFNLGQAYACLGEYDNALSAYEYSFIINPGFEAGYRECAELAFELYKYKTALKVYHEILDNFGPDCEVFANIGICYLNLKQYRQARLNLRKAMKLDPYNDEVFYHLGKCFMAESKWDIAQQYFLKAIQLEDSCENYYIGVADACYKMNDISKANYYFIKATEIGTDEPAVWVDYAKFLYEIGEYQKANDVLEDADNYTYSTELCYARIAVLMALGNNVEAMELLKEALTDDFYAHRTLFAFNNDLSNQQEISSLIHYFQPEE
jgi:tetratricopeptide (TPR) repeat protein